jgi:hypothetical protein
MKVKDLIKKLEKFPPTAKIIFSQDEEGNGFMDSAELAEEEGKIILFPYGYITE